MSDVVLRPARAADAEVVARIWAAGWLEAHEGHVSDELVRARGADTWEPRARANVPRTVVAEHEGTVVGFVVVSGDELEQLYLDLACRGRGAAVALVREAERRIAAGGHTSAWLAVVAGNEPARRFYARRGWVDAGAFLHRAPGGIEVSARRYVRDLSELDARDLS